MELGFVDRNIPLLVAGHQTIVSRPKNPKCKHTNGFRTISYDGREKNTRQIAGFATPKVHIAGIAGFAVKLSNSRHMTAGGCFRYRLERQSTDAQLAQG